MRRLSSSSAPSSEFVRSCSTVSACSTHAPSFAEVWKCARARVRTLTDLPT